MTGSGLGRSTLYVTVEVDKKLRLMMWLVIFSDGKAIALILTGA